MNKHFNHNDSENITLFFSGMGGMTGMAGMAGMEGMAGWQVRPTPVIFVQKCSEFTTCNTCHTCHTFSNLNLSFLYNYL